jgi:ankyrin repeat protein
LKKQADALHLSIRSRLQRLRALYFRDPILIGDAKGQRRAAEYLLDRGADLNWIGFDNLTPLDAARRSGADELVTWLRSLGAKSALELG